MEYLPTACSLAWIPLPECHIPLNWIEKVLDIFKCVIFFVLVKRGSWIQILSGADPAEETV